MKDIQDYAEEHGSTTDPREDVTIGTPDDGHLYTVSEVHDYWRGIETDEVSTHPYDSTSFVPPGRCQIVLDPGEEATQRGWGQDVGLEPGVYLSGRDGISVTHPPAPIAIDDEYLKFAAEAALLAANATLSDREIVAVTTGSTPSIQVGVRGKEPGEQSVVFSGFDSDIGVYQPGDDEPEMFLGFYHIRAYGTPMDIYSQAEVPRLSLDELAVDVDEVRRAGGAE